MIWLREIAGWVLLGSGLAAFALSYFVFLLPGRILEGGGMVMIGIFVFRGGLHLLKVAMAAQVALSTKPTVAPSAEPMPTLKLAGARPNPQRTASIVPGAIER